MSDGMWFLDQTMKFAQFHREIERQDLLRKSNEIAKNQLRETELQTRLLRKRKNAEREQAAQIEAQAQKIAALEQQIAAQAQQQAKAEGPSASAIASQACSRSKVVCDSSGVEIDQQRLEVLASLFIDSLCCVAVGDRKLSQVEVDHIIQVLRRLENQQEQTALQAMIVESSKRIYAAGAALHARLVCERLVANRAEATFGFILDTLRHIVGADGRSTPEELQILQIFEEQLKTHRDGAGGPRYSDLDVAQNPPSL